MSLEIWSHIVIPILIGGCPVRGFLNSMFYIRYPPLIFEDCMYRYFACSDDTTYGEWPMNARVCFRDYQVCLAELKENEEAIKRGENIAMHHHSSNSRIHITNYLHNFACHDVNCNLEDVSEFSCGIYGNIDVIYVFLGRQEDSNSCPAQFPFNPWFYNCFVMGAFEHVFKRCNGMNKCTVDLQDLDLQVCTDKKPYLEMKFSCTGFSRPQVFTSGAANPDSDAMAIVDEDIKTSFQTNFQIGPWVYIGFEQAHNVKKVIVFANKGPDYINPGDIEVRLLNEILMGPVPSDLNEKNCIKKSPWDLTFKCDSNIRQRGVLVYSGEEGMLSLKEVTVVVEKNFVENIEQELPQGEITDENQTQEENPEESQTQEENPEESQTQEENPEEDLIQEEFEEDPSFSIDEIENAKEDKNIYKIMDHCCITNTPIMRCLSYGGKIVPLGFTLGRTSNYCNSHFPRLECSEDFDFLLLSCLGKVTCMPTMDPAFMTALQSLNEGTTCSKVNFLHLRYTCDGIPRPDITSSSVVNGFLPKFLLTENNSPLEFFSTKVQARPWIQFYFGETLAVTGIKLTLVMTASQLDVFKEVEVRIGNTKVVNEMDFYGNPVCDSYNGPPDPSINMIMITCGKIGAYMLGKYLTIQKTGFGALQLRAVEIILKSESFLSYR